MALPSTNGLIEAGRSVTGVEAASHVSTKHLIIDLTEVSRVERDGLRAVMIARRDARWNGSPLDIVCKPALTTALRVNET